ncbi:fumarylacetoacetate hydrolase family protein [Fusibacter paucivorans]|uniref:Fumarylacetoacetate hydrolase family protein n=1 Tax=Fusibacter paucivorans TaxID=76009 RepID=A0ABS5PMC8_9FIRM|nr:fumarylacetoacetate hydrolase family protein [Fusibacter paucivorans]MBS7526196.1 fumarylacetoacetate hydrolase family protein [Fusibacter paucivorans]
MERETIIKLAALLKEAAETKSPTKALTELYPKITIEDAYKIQYENIQSAVLAGRQIVGKKIGLTSKAMQNMLGVGSPDYGVLTDDMILDEETPVSLDGFLQPKIEAELAFILKEDLKGPGVTLSRVLQATEGVMASFEIIDSRIENWKIKLPDTIADNASSGAIVLGSKIASLENLDLKYTGLVFEKNGEIVDTAAGAAVLGHPAYAVAWLANELAKYDITLKKGEIILAGAFTKALEAKAGDIFEATFDGIGKVRVKFTA